MPRAAVLPGPAPAWDVSAPRNVGVQVDAPPAPTHGGGGSDARRKARAFPSRDCRESLSRASSRGGGGGGEDGGDLPDPGPRLVAWKWGAIKPAPYPSGILV